MTAIVIDGLNEEDFRRSIENRLREGRPSAAIARLRRLLAPYTKKGGILPERFLTVEAAELTLSGWGELEAAIARHDQSEHPVTGLQIAFGWPGEEATEPDADGGLRPHLEVSYFTDESYPFSSSARDDLLEGYSIYGCTWNGDSVATDMALSVEGIDDLHGTLAQLEARLLESDEPDEQGIRAGSLGSCLLSVLLVQAVSEHVARNGLPRPLCVMSGSSGVYPYFDAPVVGMPEEVLKVAQAREEAAAAEEEAAPAAYRSPTPRYSSLLMTGIPRGRKRAVLVLDESEEETADRIAALRSLDQLRDVKEAVRRGSISEPAQVVPAIAEPADGLLLAKKPARHGSDLRDMITPREPEMAMVEPVPSEQPDVPEPALWSLKAYVVSPEPDAASPEPVAVSPERNAALPEPDWTAIRDELTTSSETVLMEPDLEQRLQRLLAAYDPPAVELPEPAIPVPAFGFTDSLPCGPGWVEDAPVPACPVAIATEEVAVAATTVDLRIRLRQWVIGWVRIGRASSVAISQFLTAGREKQDAQPQRKRRL